MLHIKEFTRVFVPHRRWFRIAVITVMSCQLATAIHAQSTEALDQQAITQEQPSAITTESKTRHLTNIIQVPIAVSIN